LLIQNTQSAVNSKRKARMGSSTIDRKNRKKRAVITFDDDNA